MTISHLLPRWMACDRHHDIFRDFRSHAACDVRFATDEEVEAKHRYHFDPVYHAQVHLVGQLCWMVGRLRAHVERAD